MGKNVIARTVSHLAGIAAIAAISLLPSHASAASRPPENPVCRPLAAAIGHWLPILDRAAPHPIPTGPHSWKPGAPWDDAVSAIGAYMPDGVYLPRWTGQTVNAITGLGIGFPAAQQRPLLRQALGHISRLCPSLPASVVSVPLPR